MNDADPAWLFACENCKFHTTHTKELIDHEPDNRWRGERTEQGEVLIVTVTELCRRYPKQETVTLNYWCGEHTYKETK